MVLICNRSEFQIEGPATEKALLARFVLVLGTTTSPRDAERKWSSLQMLHSSAEYEGTIVALMLLTGGERVYGMKTYETGEFLA